MSEWITLARDITHWLRSLKVKQDNFHFMIVLVIYMFDMANNFAQ